MLLGICTCRHVHSKMFMHTGYAKMISIYTCTAGKLRVLGRMALGVAHMRLAGCGLLL